MKITTIVLSFLLLISCASEKPPVDFEKIIFFTSPCFGNCPLLNLQVNKDKSILFYKKSGLINPKMYPEKMDAQENEYYKGTINDKLYNELLVEIAKTDTITYKGQNCCDAPIITMISYYNGKRKYNETMFPPEGAQKLIAILYKITESKDLVKTTKFEIEESEPEKSEGK
ncbi:hypothetical protein EV144_101121 [Flavobacterium sp. 270]|uniref:DUF6438 domain-containing protein n=1 Tax=Flavobacterium sp. 270 TaxID=2512114 RepID=UPI0010651649|nr:DUF6438 domain-containing protein [Flavobacterium sp. 270]TDW51446.1 hypothetical protein EV144_101121 [Flavobacterium sp. 270]